MKKRPDRGVFLRHTSDALSSPRPRPAHVQSAMTRPPCPSLCTCAPLPWAKAAVPYCPFHPISLLLRKETGWSPKETRFWAPPRDMFGPTRLSHELEAPTSQPTASSRLERPVNHQAPPQVGRGTNSLPTCSAHADGGDTGVKKRFSLAARHRFFGQAPKKWGRKAGQGNDYLPRKRRTRTRQRK